MLLNVLRDEVILALKQVLLRQGPRLTSLTALVLHDRAALVARVQSNSLETQ